MVIPCSLYLSRMSPLVNLLAVAVEKARELADRFGVNISPPRSAIFILPMDCVSVVGVGVITIAPLAIIKAFASEFNLSHNFLILSMIWSRLIVIGSMMPSDTMRSSALLSLLIEMQLRSVDRRLRLPFLLIFVSVTMPDYRASISS